MKPKALIGLRVVVWLLFGVVVAVMPAGCTWHDRLLAHERHDWLSVFWTGEVQLAAAILAAGAVGDLLLALIHPAKPYKTGWMVGALFFGFAVFGIGLYLFAAVSSSANKELYAEMWGLAPIETVLILLCAVVTGCASISLRTAQELEAAKTADGQDGA